MTASRHVGKRDRAQIEQRKRTRVRVYAKDTQVTANHARVGPSFKQRRFELRSSDGVPTDVGSARALRIWLEDGTELEVELYEREPGRLFVRAIDVALVYEPNSSNTAIIAARK